MTASLRALLTAALAVTALPAGAQSTARMEALPGRDGRIERACNSAGTTRTTGFRRSVGDSARAVSVAAAPPAGTTPVTGGTVRSQQYPEYDVVLEVPRLCVQNISLKVDTLTAKIELDARVSNLVRISAGADVFVGNVDLTIRGVRAQALLLVDLDDVYHVVDQTLTFVDNHPEIVQQLGSTLQNTGATVGGVVGNVLGAVNGLLLGTSRNAAGQVVQRLVDQATGRIIERTLAGAGRAAADKVLGSITDLPVLSETTNAAGQVVRRVREEGGKVLEYVRGAGGAVSALRLVP